MVGRELGDMVKSGELEVGAGGDAGLRDGALGDGRVGWGGRGRE